MPEDKFECIWSKDTTVSITNQKGAKNKKKS
jgi:hypothetical protein|nr:MAG TPA: hypothetical protein [Caudoviricetes sp.]